MAVPAQTIDDPSFKRGDRFIAALLENFRAYFYNGGFVRVPAEAVYGNGDPSLWTSSHAYLTHFMRFSQLYVCHPTSAVC